MSQSLDESYFEWLCDQVGTLDSDHTLTHRELLCAFHNKEFVWFVANDFNRIDDGRACRYEFVEETNQSEVDAHWMGDGCSVLEMMVGLSRRLAFEAGGEPPEWFWALVTNLEMADFSDRAWSSVHQEVVDDALDILVFRNYHPDGQGGLFPLHRPESDQRYLELWYQLNAYLLELD